MTLTTLTPLLLGLLSGSVLGLTGAGGAIIAVPILVFGLDLTVAEASPIALLAVAMSASLGAFIGYRKGILRYKAAAVMSVFGICLSPIGLLVASQIPGRPLTLIFSIVLLYVSVNLFRQAQRELREEQREEPLGLPCMLDQTQGKLTWTLTCFRSMVASGVVAGFLSGLLGVGGGFVIVPALKKFTDLPVHSIIATSLGVITLVSIGGVLVATASGVMNWEIAIPFATGALSGMSLARKLGEKIRGPHLQQVFALFAFSIALSMILRSLQ